MSLTSLVAPQLPFLRRYARALTGRQAGGDAYVAAMLEALIADPSLFDRTLDPRVAAFKVLSQIWNAVPTNTMVLRFAATSAVDRHLEALTPMPRQAFLLSAVEDFSLEQVAAILGVSTQEASDLIDEAGREINTQISTSVLIIEDEPMIAMDLENLVEELGHHVVGNARTRSEAVEMANAFQPGIILADIRLADGSSGLDAVTDILASFEVPIIFITAYPETLLTGERPEPTFLIAKPFNEETVRGVISQALLFDVKARRVAA